MYNKGYVNVVQRVTKTSMMDAVGVVCSQPEYSNSGEVCNSYKSYIYIGVDLISNQPLVGDDRCSP